MSGIRGRFAAHLPIVLGLGALLCCASARAAEIYHLAVVPQHTPIVTYQTWKPFTDQLARVTGLTIRLKVFRTFDEFEADLTNGLSELAFMNPYHQVVAHKAQGYIPLVRNGGQKLKGVLVVPKDSPIRTLRDLNGKTIGFPDPNAFAASLYLRALLRERENITFKSRYLISHSNVYRHVIVGNVDAGGGANITLSRERPETRDALHVLYETPGVVAHPLSAHPRVPEKVRTAITTAVLAMARDPDGQLLLKGVLMEKPSRADFGRDYLPLEQLHLQRHNVVTKLPVP